MKELSELPDTRHGQEGTDYQDLNVPDSFHANSGIYVIIILLSSYFPVHIHNYHLILFNVKYPLQLAQH
jgi:hypothetical protein